MPTSPSAEQLPEQVLHLPEEAAEKLNVTRYWLIQNAKARRIPHRRLSPRLYRFTDEDIAAIAQMAAVPAEKAG